MTQLSAINGIADLRIQQPFNQPKLHINVDRTKTIQAGFTQKDVAGNLLVSLSGSFQTSPSFWLDPKSGVSYTVATVAPQYNIQTLQDLENIPVTGAGGATRAPWQQLGNLGTVTRGVGMATVSHYDAQTMIDIYGSTQGRDLGGVAQGNRIDRQSESRQSAARLPNIRSRPDRDDAQFICRPSGRTGICDSPDLSTDCRQFPVLARSVHHHFRVAGRSRRDRLDAVRDAYDDQRARADGLDHVHGRGHGEQHSGGELFKRTCPGRA